ncbi:MAG: phage tail assembly chaperone [Novosphingobium sp.]
MSGTFGKVAARLSGQAALLLGWAPDRFWAATPEELATILAAMRMPGGDSMDRGTIDRLMEQDRDG